MLFRSDVVLFEADFPRKKQLSRSEQAQNENLREKYGVEGFPTLVLIDASGKELGRFGYVPGGSAAFRQNLVESSRGVLSGSGEPQPAAAAQAKQKESSIDLSTLPQAVVPSYPGLKLKGISGSKNRRLALINDQTVGVGEGAHVRMGSGRARLPAGRDGRAPGVTAGTR